MTRSAPVLPILYLSFLSACGGASTQIIIEPPPPPPPEPVTDPGLVTLTGALGNRFVPAGESSELWARLRTTAAPLDGQERAPINLGLVIDTSGSMQGDAIENAKAATLTLIDMLVPGDRVSLVTFGSRTEVLFPSALIDEASREELRRAVGRMEATGTTDMASGLQTGLQQVLTFRLADGVNRIVLLGDGVPNDEAPLRPLAQQAQQSGVAITALGLGLDFNETLMGDIAQLSGGRFHYIEESNEVAHVFRDEVLRLSRLVAQGAVLVIQPGPGVEIAAVAGENVVADGNRVQVQLGDLAEGEHRDVIVRLEVPGRREGALVELLDATLAFQDRVRGAGGLSRQLFLGAEATEDDDVLEHGRDAEVEREAREAQASAVLIEAIRAARAGQMAQADALLDAAQGELAPDDALMQGVQELRQTLPQIAPPAPNAPSRGNAETERRIRRRHHEAVQSRAAQPPE